MDTIPRHRRRPPRAAALDERQDRDGFALVAALFALVILSLLVTGGALLARQESRISSAGESAAGAVRIAEEGITEALAKWSSTGLQDLAVSASDSVTGTTADGTWTVRALRTSERTYFLTSEGEVTGRGRLSGANRKLGLLVRVITPDLDPPAAVATQGSMTVAGSSNIEGHDTNPSAWDGDICPTATGDEPGILINDSTNVSENGNSYEIDGDPPIAQDTTMTADDLLDFGDMTWEDLADMAGERYESDASITNTGPDSVSTGGGYECDASTEGNWGDPASPGSACFGHFPIIYAAQDMDINSSSKGQGILMVEGDLRIQGGFEFYGVVLVKGTFTTAGTGGHVNGGVISTNADLDTSTVTGNAVVTNSTCAAKRAVENNADLSRPTPVGVRSWIDVSAVSG